MPAEAEESEGGDDAGRDAATNTTGGVAKSSPGNQTKKITSNDWKPIKIIDLTIPRNNMDRVVKEVTMLRVKLAKILGMDDFVSRLNVDEPPGHGLPQEYREDLTKDWTQTNVAMKQAEKYVFY